MDYQLLIDRILENESLTGDLEDGPAEQLLRWGIQQVRVLVSEVDDEESAGAKVNALLALMRHVTRLANSCSGAHVSALAEQLGRLLESRALAFGSDSPATEEEVVKAAALLREMPPDRAMVFLLDWLNGEVAEES